ncbi:MAG: hypothetical protein QME14_03825 [Methanobacteriaceae archaeon]|nr:hypothetical protein [Methanobacteriaceae archaeon]
MKNNLICISGPDGTGKTTQVNLLIKNLKEFGINYEYRWLRFQHFFSLPLLAFARLIGLSEVEKLENGDKIGYHFFYKSKIVSNIYILLIYLDTLFSTIFKVYIPIYIYRSHIACDRFVYDTLIDIMISTREYNLHKSIIGKLFICLIPKNSYILILITDENTLKSRRRDIRHDKNINLKIKLYKEIAKKYQITVFDANLAVNDINNQILRILNE